MCKPYVRGKGTEKECIQYGNRVIRSDDVIRDIQTLNCYHDIRLGRHDIEMRNAGLHKIYQINDWLRQVEIAFGLDTPID